MADGKKITDILPPEKTNDANEQNIATATISKHASTGTFGAQDDNNPTQTVSTSAETQGEMSEPTQMASKAGVDIKPMNENVEPEPEPNPENSANKPEVSDFVSKPDDSNTPEDSTEEASDVSENSDGPVIDKAYEASDSLPDENDKKTAEATDGMQTPKIYDTKEYFVPIKNTTHSHGKGGIIIAGIVSALLVAAVVAVAAIYLY